MSTDNQNGQCLLLGHLYAVSRGDLGHWGGLGEGLGEGEFEGSV